FDRATEMLQVIWAKTATVLFFDTGEYEMPPSFGLPSMLPSPRAWLTQYLEATCDAATIQHLGEHPALDAEGATCTRNLFAVIRRQSAGIPRPAPPPGQRDNGASASGAAGSG